MEQSLTGREAERHNLGIRMSIMWGKLVEFTFL